MKLTNTLEKKVFLSFIFISLASILALYSTLQLSVYSAFNQLEQQESVKNQTRAISVIDSQHEKLALIIREYAEWDDTYNFLKNNVSKDFDNNFSREYFKSIDLDCVLILGPDGAIKWAYLRDPGGTPLDMQAQLLEPLNMKHPLVQLGSARPGTNGFWRIRSGLLMIVSRPVFRSDGFGDTPGSLVMGQFFGEKLVAELSAKSAANMQLFTIDSSTQDQLQNSVGSMRAVSPGLLSLQRADADDGQTARPIALRLPTRHWASDEQQDRHQNALSWGSDHHSIHDHLVYRDLFDQLQGVLQITTPRHISKLGINSLSLTLFSMLAATIVIGLIFIVIMRAVIIRPIQTIKAHMLRMGKSGDLKARIGMNRIDEIGALAMEFDHLAGKLEGTQEQLEATRDQALTLAKTKSEFLATMSHEIRTPMNGVLGMAELLSRTVLDDTQRKFVRNIQSSGDLLLTVINDILDYSQIESGKLKLETSSFNLRDLVKETIDVMAVHANKKGIDLTHSFPSVFDEWIVGDANRIRQVLVNLIGNAIKFTDQGSVDVKVSVKKELTNLQSVLIEVIDTGVGIRKDQQEKIFEEFVQADNGPVRRYGGTGLGLSISNKLVGLMGGSIGLDSIPGQGSRFWFSLQLPSAQAPHATEQLLASLNCTRVLIIDANETSGKFLNTQIRAWGMSGDIAVDGLQALKTLRSAADNDPYQLVLLDDQIPVIGGVGVLHRIREDAALSDLPVVMLGSLANAEKERLSGYDGCDHFLSRPVQTARLYQCLVKIIAGTKASRKPPDCECQIRQFKAHVLVAEDNLVNQEVIKNMLKTMGITADIASDGTEAVSMSGKHNYDLILMDSHMPNIDGFQATTLIRQREEKYTQGKLRTPIVAVTADAHEHAREECIKVGMDDFLAKPINLRLLQDALTRWLPGCIDNQEIMSRTFGEKTDYNAVFRAGTSAQIIDQHALNELRALQQPGEPELLTRVIEQYLDLAPSLMDQAVAALGNGDHAALYNSAHSLKSCSASVGAMRLSKCACELERMGRENDLAHADTAVAKLEHEFQATVTALNHELMIAGKKRQKRGQSQVFELAQAFN